MADNQFPYEEDNSTLELVFRYENMLSNDDILYFDIEEFEYIIEYYIGKSHFNKALKTIELAFKQHPFAINLKLKQAQILASSNKQEKALSLLKEMEIIEPTNPEINITKGAIYSQLNKYQMAIDEYFKVIDNDDENLDDIYYSIASEYEKLGKFDKTLEFLKKSIAENPDNEAAIYEIALCFELVQKTKEGIKYFEEFLDAYPYSKTAWFNLGSSYNNLNQYDKAADAYDYAIAIDETFIAAYFNKAGAYISMGKFEKAIDIYKETFEYDDPDAITICNIGECYEKLGSYNQAIEYYKEALELDNQMPDAWLGAGICYDELGIKEKAIEYLSKAIELEPLNPEYLYILGDTYFKSEDYFKAREIYYKVSGADPSDDDIWIDIAETYAKEYKFKNALEILDKGIELFPENYKLYYKAVIYASEISDRNLTAKYLQKGLQINYEEHIKLFEYKSELVNNKEILSLLQNFKQEED